MQTIVRKTVNKQIIKIFIYFSWQKERLLITPGIEITIGTEIPICQRQTQSMRASLFSLNTT
jgi:hypothetical protein